VTNPVVSVLLGVLVLQERLDQPPAWHVVLAVGGLALALFGAVLIASVSEGAREAEETTERHAAPPRPQTA
jgi:EamA domain-containing membrane protein RarD